MNGVLGMTELALETELSPEQRDYLTMARCSADSLLTVINDVLDFSKIEGGMVDLNLIEFQPRENIEETIRALALSAHQKGLEFVCDIDRSVPGTLVGDALRIRQVLVNLIGNAIKFTQRGEVVVNVGGKPVQAGNKSDWELHFAVRDTGIGISRGVLADWLSHWEMWPILAESGPAALKVLESVVEPVPLILTDVHMPEMDGFELLKHIKIHSQIPTVIMLTSGSYAGDVARSRELGAEAYLIKPVRRSELLETILKILAAHPPTSRPVATSRESARPFRDELLPPTSGGLHILVAEDNIIKQRYVVSLLEHAGFSAVVVSKGREAIGALERES